MSSLPPHRCGVVHSVQIGQIRSLGPDSVPSGFVKKAVDGPVALKPLGIVGDEQADLRVHGGPNKAVYAYPYTHYASWRAAFPQHESLLVPGGLGENLTLLDCSELEVCVGDIVTLGTATLQVTQPRQPCFKFALRFDDISMPRAMMKNGRCGWYYRVLEPGTLQAGDLLGLKERPFPGWSIDRVNRLIIQRRGTPAQRAEFALLVESFLAPP